MEFWKNSGCFFGPAFPQKTIVFQWKEDKTKFSLNFQFALYDSLKALTGCLEKLRFAKIDDTIWSIKRFELILFQD